MKGFTKDGKFHPITDYKKGIRKSRDKQTKTQGITIRKKIDPYEDEVFEKVSGWKFSKYPSGGDRNSFYGKEWINKKNHSSIAVRRNDVTGKWNVTIEKREGKGINQTSSQFNKREDALDHAIALQRIIQ